MYIQQGLCEYKACVEVFVDAMFDYHGAEDQWIVLFYVAISSMWEVAVMDWWPICRSPLWMRDLGWRERYKMCDQMLKIVR